MMLPAIPKEGSRQRRVLMAILNENPKVWVMSVDGITHDQFVRDVYQLRAKRWPIEDMRVFAEDPSSPHGYRIDADRWALLRNRLPKFW